MPFHDQPASLSQQSPCKCLELPVQVDLPTGRYPCLSVRCHDKSGRQPRIWLRQPIEWRGPPVREIAPLGPEARLLPVNPASSLGPSLVGAINLPHHNFAIRQPPPQTPANSPAMQHLVVDAHRGLLSTTVSCWPSWPGSVEEPKASQSLPALPLWLSRMAVGFTLEVRHRRSPPSKNPPCGPAGALRRAYPIRATRWR